MDVLKNFSIFNFLWRHKHHHQEPEGPRQYKQMAITPEAHAAIVARADKHGDSIIDTVDKLMGVNQ